MDVKDIMFRNIKNPNVINDVQNAIKRSITHIAHQYNVTEGIVKDIMLDL